MTPNDIEILIHYTVCPSEHLRKTAPAVQESAEKFIELGIFERRDHTEDSTSSYIATNKGRALLQILCNTPMPEEAWIDQNQNIIEVP
jgi:hypothetical protein